MDAIYWKSFGDFIHMGGHGLYVWGAYAMTLAVMVIEPALAAQRRRSALATAADEVNT